MQHISDTIKTIPATQATAIDECRLKLADELSQTRLALGAIGEESPPESVYAMLRIFEARLYQIEQQSSQTLASIAEALEN